MVDWYIFAHTSEWPDIEMMTIWPAIFFGTFSSSQVLHQLPGTQHQLDLNKEVSWTKNVFLSQSFNM